MGLIPDGWNDYVRMGKPIDKTRFIAFKVPLREGPNHNLNISEENKWYPKLLVTLIPNIGIIIDITNTTKYYNPKDFLEMGVDHKKIFVEGHHIPSKENYYAFRGAVKKFLQDNKSNDKLIGVHCTHGLNRTGFLVCRYMIEEMKMTADEAISLFEDARGHKIKRQNYINKLKILAKARSPSADIEVDLSATASHPRRIGADHKKSGKSYERHPPSRRQPPSGSASSRSSHRRSPVEYSRMRPREYRNRSSLPLSYQSAPQPQHSNWRDPSHQYTPSSTYRIPKLSHQDHRRSPAEPTASNRLQHGDPSRFRWRREEK